MKILVCGKGGCGKSTVAELLAVAMRKRGKRVFLVDADESNIGLYRMVGVDMPEPLMDCLGGETLTPEVEKDLAEALTSVAVIGRLPDNRTIFLNNLKGKAMDVALPEMEAVCDAIEAW